MASEYIEAQHHYEIVRQQAQEKQQELEDLNEELIRLQPTLTEGRNCEGYA